MEHQLQSDAGARISSEGPTHSVQGRIDHGDKRGRALGFPTANKLPIGYLRWKHPTLAELYALLPDSARSRVTSREASADSA